MINGRVLQGYFHVGRKPDTDRRLPPERLPGMGILRVGAVQGAEMPRRRDAVATLLLNAGMIQAIGPGRRLDVGLRRSMERTLAADLSAVQIYQGPAAHALGALAFTLGDQIHFAPGLYDPSSREGLELLGHELTHIVQQRSGRLRNPYGQGIAVVQDPALEAEADRMGRQLARAWSSPGCRPLPGFRGTGQIRSAAAVAQRMEEQGWPWGGRQDPRKPARFGEGTARQPITLDDDEPPKTTFPVLSSPRLTTPPGSHAHAKQVAIGAPAAELVDALNPLRKVRLRRDSEFVIGRDPQSGLVLTDKHVSRKQAVITCDDGTFFISCCGKAPVLVHGQGLGTDPYPLTDGDSIQILDLKYTFRLIGQPRHAPPSALIVTSTLGSSAVTAPVDPGELYRAAALQGVKQAFCLSPREQRKLLGNLSSLSGGFHGRRKIVPLAGVVTRLARVIATDQLNRLLALAVDYIEGASDTWNEAQAKPRIALLKGMTSLLHEWATIYQQPALRLEPSTAQWKVMKSPLSPDECVGLKMKATLTLDPGELVGYEPEDSATFTKLSRLCPGFVRAHLLNKHLGGHGAPANIGYLSGTDNDLMSQVVEEYVKCEVLENGSSVAFFVIMTPGRLDLCTSHFLDETTAAIIVKEVWMRVEVTDLWTGKKTLYLPTNGGERIRIKGQWIYFSTQMPSTEGIGRIQPHHKNVIADREKQNRYAPLFGDTGSDVFEQEYRALRHEQPSMTHLPERMAESKRKFEQAGLGEKEVEARVQSLGQHTLRNKQLAEAQARKKSKVESNANNWARVGFVAKHSLKNIEKDVFGLTQPMFKRLQELCRLGANARVVLENDYLREPNYSAALKLLASKGADLLTQNQYHRLTSK